MRDRIGAAGKLENKKEVKKHFNRIFGDLLVSVDKAFTELSEAIKKKTENIADDREENVVRHSLFVSIRTVYGKF